MYNLLTHFRDLNNAFMNAKVAKTTTSETTATLGQSLYVEVCVALGAASTQIYFSTCVPELTCNSGQNSRSTLVRTDVD